MTLKYPGISLIKGLYRKSTTGRTLWCGPFLVAQITGLDYDTAYAKVLADIRRAIMANRRKRAGLYGKVSRAGLPTMVKGTYEHQIMRCLGKLGVKGKLTYYGQMKYRPTLITFARDHTVKGKTYAIVAGNHWVTLKDGVLYHSHHDPLPIEEAPAYQRARVECWAAVRPLAAALVGN